MAPQKKRKRICQPAVYEGGAEGVEALLNKPLLPNKRDFPSRLEEMTIYAESLKACIKWLQEANLLEQEKLRSALESKVEMNAKIEELKETIGELQRAREDRDREDRDRQVVKYAELCEKYDKLAREVTEWKKHSQSQTLEVVQDSSSTQREHALESQLAAANEKLKMARTENKELKGITSDQKQQLAEAERQLAEAEKQRKKMHNTIQELKGNIRVFCRVRPLWPDERSGSRSSFISYPTSIQALGRGIDVTKKREKYHFEFDKVFNQEASQEDVFVEISQLVQSAIDGYKVCIFAYGQTGSGKTYTMMGKPEATEQNGLIPRSLEQIFKTCQALGSQGWKYNMQASMLEIYNDTIQDLLVTKRSINPEMTGGTGKQPKINHDAKGNTVVSDLTIVDVRSIKEISSLLLQAVQSRSVGKTQMNEQSSRSHFVFTLRISGVNVVAKQKVQGVLNLIDLAGSERVDKSGATGDCLKETQYINKSLTFLSDVILALARKSEFVPFRNSKLTLLLQPYLGGDSKTLMFVNVSPKPSSMDETLRSLQFAEKVNSCETKMGPR